MSSHQLILFLIFLWIPNSLLWAVDYSNTSQQVQKQWTALLRYKQGTGFKKSGEVDSTGFYLHPQGHLDPQAEWQASIRALSSSQAHNQNPNQHAQCVFPARLKLIKKYFPQETSGWPTIECADWKKFQAKIPFLKAHIYFSSYHLESPASAFGHTLLKISKNPQDREDLALLDYGINFSATINTENPVAYMVKGLIGFFPGNFSLIPFFYKAREYNDFEMRDLWGYPLNLNNEQLEFLLAHLWEMSAVTFDYFYFTQNCSSQLLDLLEAIDPKFHFADELPFYIVPIETIKILQNYPGLLGPPIYRPSLRSSFYQKVAQLNNQEQALLQKLIEQQNFTQVKNDPQLIPVIDTLIDWLDYKHNKEIILGTNPKISEFKQQTLIFRGQLGQEPPERKNAISETPALIPISPDQTHGSRRFTWGINQSNLKEQTSWQFNFKFALHDLTDPWRGLSPYSQIDFFDLKTRLTKSKFVIEDFSFFRVHSLNPFNPYEKKLSWQVDLHYQHQTHGTNQTYNYLSLLMGGGATWSFQSFTLSPQMHFYMDLYQPRTSAWGSRLGPGLWWRYDFTDAIILGGEFNWHYFIGPQKKYKFSSQTLQQSSLFFTYGLNKNWALKVRWLREQILEPKKEVAQRTSSLYLVHYF